MHKYIKSALLKAVIYLQEAFYSVFYLRKNGLNFRSTPIVDSGP
jgi:hypothetical protein